jgi:TolB-like protein/DNA-binding winged helix-turn-helix (wHTH) protein/Tfp pilus assembly protein PilF
MPNGVYKFDQFEIDGVRYELRRGDRVLKLEKLPMELLSILVESQGRLVTRDEIIEKIWGKDVFLDTEHGINTAIRKIRQVLGDDSDQPRFVQTVTGKGYRFIAQVTIAAPATGSGIRVESDPSTASPTGLSQPLRVKPRTSLRTITFLLAAATCVAAASIGFNVAGVRDRFFGRSKPQIRSLAVLPLENLSADPAQEYFADGMTDELITMLAQNPGLRVISRTSVMQYKQAHRPLRQIARELGVDGILEGSVGRSGNRVHINAQLIYAPTDTHLWAESYERDLNEVGSLQSDLARTIARQVGLTTSAVSTPKIRITPEAHDAYLMGRYYWFARDYDKGLEYFQKAIQLQPDYAAAWAGVADYYTAQAAEGNLRAEPALAHAEPAARKALALDDDSAEAHHSMAAVHYFLRWDWNSAEQEMNRSLELRPQASEAHHLHAYLLQTLQRTDASIQEDRLSMEQDPFARPWVLGYAFLRARQYDAALIELRARSEVQPADCVVHSMLSDVYFHKGMATEYEKELKLCMPDERAPELEHAFQRGGIRGVLEWRLGRLTKAAEKEYISTLRFAKFYARLGRKEDSIRALQQSYQDHEPWLVHIQNEPDLDLLHSDPRYQEIVNKMGLPPAQ